MTQSHLMPNQHEALTHRLKQAFPFRDEDLAANRIGKLTESQRLLLRRNKDGIACQGWGVILVFVFVMCMMITQSLTTRVSYDLGPLLLLGIIGSAILVIFIIPFGQMEINQDLKTEQVITRQGAIKHTFTPMKGGKAYYIVLHHTSFKLKVTYEVYEAFLENEEYILYYTPNSLTLVAAEHVIKVTPLPHQLGNTSFPFFIK
jgi:hypothetical protein